MSWTIQVCATVAGHTGSTTATRMSLRATLLQCIHDLQPERRPSGLLKP